MRNLYTNTVSSELWDTLLSLMKMEELLPFRLVGGTALSLQLGHRVSVDIDLFTDAAYESVDFQVMDKLFQSHFPFVETIFWENTGFGKAYYIGNSRKNMIKVDMFYTDAFIRPAIEVDTIRMASIEDITAMKMDVISRTGRKKDFWDIHQLLENSTISEMIALHAERYSYSHSEDELRQKLLDFSFADDDFSPICLKGKYWELIKEDIREAVIITQK